MTTESQLKTRVREAWQQAWDEGNVDALDGLLAENFQRVTRGSDTSLSAAEVALGYQQYPEHVVDPSLYAKMPLADDVDLPALARRTPRFTGADLEDLTRRAGLAALGLAAARVVGEVGEHAAEIRAVAGETVGAVDRGPDRAAAGRPVRRRGRRPAARGAGRPRRPPAAGGEPRVRRRLHIRRGRRRGAASRP